VSYTTICGTIAADVLIDCNDIPVNGSADRIILMNKADIDLSTTTIDAAGQITSLAMKATKEAFEITGQNQSITPEMSLVRQGSVSRYSHQVGFRAFKIDQATKNEIEKMANGQLVAICETLGNKYEVYGWDVGLRAEEITRNLNDVESNGLFSVVLRTPDNLPAEPKLPRSYLNTDYDTTTTQLEGLLTA